MRIYILNIFMYKHFIYFITFLSFFNSTAQEINSLWETHFSYNNVNDLESNEPYIYASSDNSIFIYNTQTSELTKITTKEGLAGEAISSIYFSVNHNKLIAGFVNGLIQVIDFNTSNIFSIYDIIDKTTISPSNKRINNFNEFDQNTYISTDYGVSVFNLDSLEFGDTFFIGISAAQVSVAETTVLGEYIYAACKNFEGIKRALISSNLIDFNNWSEVTSGSFYSIFSTDNTVYFSDQTKIYNIENGNISELFTASEIIKDIRYISESFIITTHNNTSIYDINFNIINTPINSSNFQTNFNSALFNSNNIYIATEDIGILKLDSNNIDNYSSIYPEGPLDNNIFSTENFNNDLWVTFGEYSLYYNPHPLKYKGISNYNSNWNNIVYDSLPSNSVNLNSISIDPFNNNHIFISSFHGGLLEIIDNEIINLLDNTNTPLESIDISDPNYTSVRISDTEFDDSGVLWILNSRVDNPLKSYDPNSGQWQSYDFTDIIPDGLNDELGFSDIEIGQLGNKWIGGLRSGLIGFNENSGSPLLKKIFDMEQANLPSPYVRSLAVDKNNHLWIGTVEGLRVLYNTTNFFDSNVITQPIVILEDGIPKELLEQQFISDIEVDGANNKWVGTIGSGIFYFSQNGQQTIYHFTKSNSPIPSNNINDISIDQHNGIVYIGTDKGLVSYNTGGSATESNFENAYVFPNPVRPSFNMKNDKIKIKGITDNVNIKITDIEGNLVAEAQSNINSRYNNFNLEIDGGTAFWNGKNLAGKSVSSGVYIVMLSELETYETKILKIMIIR